MKTIEIPQPCPVNWKDMNKAEGGRFCDLCSKKVHDFKGWNTADIIRFVENSPTSICGRIEQPVAKPFFEHRFRWVSLIVGAFMLIVSACKSIKPPFMPGGTIVVQGTDSGYVCNHMDPKTLDFQHKPNFNDTLNRNGGR
jgi:hypothetical protein